MPTCSAKMEVTAAGEKQALPFLDEMSGHPSMARYLNQGSEVQIFAFARELLNSDYRTENGCLILDIQMHGLSALDLQQELLATGSTIPVIFITAFDSVEVREQPRKLGAAGYLHKPVDDQALFDAIIWALGKSP